jgi:zinc protease
LEDRDLPTIDIRAMVKTGSAYEPGDKIGLASLAGQSMRLGGSVNMSGDEMDRVLEGMASTIEIYMGESSGTILVSCLKENFDSTLQIFAGLLADPAFPPDRIDLAKIRLKSMISRRNDQIEAVTNREFAKLIYGSESPYARTAEYSTIEAVTREDILTYYLTYFFPENVTMTVWGDFNAAEMKSRLETTLGEWKTLGVPVPEPPAIDYQHAASINLVKMPNVKQSYIMLGHIGGLLNNPDYPALVVMNSILSYQRMFKKIRTDEGLAYSVWGNYDSGYRLPGIFSAGAQTKAESTGYAIELMLAEIRRMTEEEVGKEELANAKDQYLNSFVFNFESKADIINRMMTYAYFGYPGDFADKVKSGVEKVSEKDVLRVAKKYLRLNALHILVVGNPELFDKALDTLGEVRIIDINIPLPEKK